MLEESFVVVFQLRLCTIGLLLSSLSWAGTNLVLVGSSVLNNTGATVDDLHVQLTRPAAAGSFSGAFGDPGNPLPANFLDFSKTGFSLTDGAQDTIQMLAIPSGNLMLTPFIQSYYWTVGGTQQGPTIYPLVPGFEYDGSTGLYSLFLNNQTATDMSYENATLALNNSLDSVITGVNGTVPHNDRVLLAAFARPSALIFGYRDPLISGGIGGVPGEINNVAIYLSTPEPTTLLMVVTGGVMLLALWRFRRVRG